MKVLTFIIILSASSAFAQVFVPVSLSKGYKAVTIKGCSCSDHGQAIGCPKSVGCKKVRTEPLYPPLSPTPNH
jgi:hypothetical protein